MYKKLSLLKRDEERSDGGSSNEDTSKSFKLLRLQPPVESTSSYPRGGV